MRKRHHDYTDAELLGTPGSGKCMDCKWYEDSAVAKACGCHSTGPLSHDELERRLINHAEILMLARMVPFKDAAYPPGPRGRV